MERCSSSSLTVSLINGHNCLINTVTILAPPPTPEKPGVPETFPQPEPMQTAKLSCILISINYGTNAISTNDATHHHQLIDDVMNAGETVEKRDERFMRGKRARLRGLRLEDGLIKVPLI
ncbi:hypothetical protein Zmor_024563 [Zophobas morio]|uniref:Uncharacterized protein n=1 Tax=Zophobas morio TaxID=2755281 RepID=A0AA38I127_9CUCU|nr:hypothetical protein Zmor_024563 [Zophobas morio]